MFPIKISIWGFPDQKYTQWRGAASVWVALYSLWLRCGNQWFPTASQAPAAFWNMALLLPNVILVSNQINHAKHPMSDLEELVPHDLGAHIRDTIMQIITSVDTMPDMRKRCTSNCQRLGRVLICHIEVKVVHCYARAPQWHGDIGNDWHLWHGHVYRTHSKGLQW